MTVLKFWLLHFSVHVGAGNIALCLWRDQGFIIVKGRIAIKVSSHGIVLIVSESVCINVFVQIWSAYEINLHPFHLLCPGWHHRAVSPWAETFSREAEQQMGFSC